MNTVINIKKGELGSPYAIKNIYKIDRNLHDSLIGENSDEYIDKEFSAFVEACHILGIRVMLDFVFRTCARDNDLITNHPDWFYWIDNSKNETFHALDVDNEDSQTIISNRSIKSLYKTPLLHEYLASFCPDPKSTDLLKWDNLVLTNKTTFNNILDIIQGEYNITTVPGFSDVLNDTQPPWSDITFFRFYFDLNKKVQRLLNKDMNYPPFILQDGIKSSLFPGTKENKELFNYILEVIPYYQNNFGIDGARIDMSHALPEELNNDIIAKCKKNNPNFILFSEEFNPKNSNKVKNEGYHMICGSFWALYRDFGKTNFPKRLKTDISNTYLPITASPETPDTPRISTIIKDENKLHSIIFLNFLLPNTVPFLNNGLEINEAQPMNLGLS